MTPYVLSPLKVREAVRNTPRGRRRVAVLLAILVAALMLHHAGSEMMDHSEGMDHGAGADPGGATMTLCLAVLGLGAIGLTLAQAWRSRGRRYLLHRGAWTASLVVVDPPLTGARASPHAVLQVFRL